MKDSNFIQKSVEFWNSQESSNHRSDDQEFYKKKALEHFRIIQDYNANLNSIVDIGCGFGEMLLDYHKIGLIVNEGIDNSEKAIEIAKKNCNGLSINLKVADVFDYIKNSQYNTYLACGSINQYLPLEEQIKFLDDFAKNPNCHHLFYFDTVDPYRKTILRSGSEYSLDERKHSTFKKFKLYINTKVIPGFKVMNPLNSDCIYLGSAGMGFGYIPKFWFKQAKRLGLKISIISSQYYEYRYHVIFSRA